MTTEPLTVLWHPNVSDAWHGIRLGWWGTPKRVLRSLVMFLIFPSVVVGWILHQSLHLTVPTTMVVALLAGAAWGIAFHFLFGAWLARFTVKAQRKRGDPHRIIINENGVERVLADAKVTSPWTAILRVEETPRTFILEPLVQLLRSKSLALRRTPT